VQQFHLGGSLHFIGIGGIGMSGIAEVLHASGYRVTGSDCAENANVKRLRSLGVDVAIGHEPHTIEQAGVVIVSTAIQPSNVELIAARIKGIPVIKRAEMLAELMRLKRSICISGSHGKTTTTSLCAALLDAAGGDPTVVNGGIINAYGTNARLGKGEWFVAEADESDGSFLKLPGTIGIVTNIDPEHMEHFGTFENLVNAFDRFIHNLPFYGLAVLCSDHPVVRSLADQITDRRVVTYGLQAGADIRAVNIHMSSSGSRFDVTFNPKASIFKQNERDWKALEGIELPLYGEHNVQNALSIVAVAIELRIGEEMLRKALSSFAGVKRRFTKTGEACGVAVIDDYAHHPVEIKAVLKAARQASGGKVVAVLQPHRYTRLSSLFQDFIEAFDLADSLIVCPVYSAGEDPIEGVNEQSLAQGIAKFYPKKTVVTISHESELAPCVMNLIASGDLVVCMGAGTISTWANQLPDQLVELSLSAGHHAEAINN
jgi:UDP-N-acetylmuramate--alanine ligase